jgi:serine/threonine-protein kinase RIM15
LETLLTRMGCRCIVVADGSEAASVANGDIRFDVIMLDLNMPISKRSPFIFVGIGTDLL